MIAAESDLVEIDESAHKNEHSLEVQLPFIQHFKPDFNLVPIWPAADELRGMRGAGEAIASAAKQRGKPVLIVASSDMSHYISAEAAKRMTIWRWRRF